MASVSTLRLWKKQGDRDWEKEKVLPPVHLVLLDSFWHCGLAYLHDPSILDASHFCDVFVLVEYHAFFFWLLAVES